MVEIKFSWYNKDGSVTTETSKVDQSVADYLESLHDIINTQNSKIVSQSEVIKVQSVLIEGYRIVTS